MRSATRRFAELANELDVAVAFDVNLRAHLWESMDAFREAIDPLIDLSTIVKVSEDEIVPVLGTDDPDEATAMLLERGVTLALVSMGGDGALYATRDFSGRVPIFDDRRGRRRHGRGGRVPGGHPHPPLRAPGLGRGRGGGARGGHARDGGRARWPARTSGPCAPCRAARSSSASWPGGAGGARVGRVAADRVGAVGSRRRSEGSPAP